MTEFILGAAAIYGLLGVMLGAFGAHALANRLTATMKTTWHTAVEYQFYHAFALLATGLLLRSGLDGGWLVAAGLCFFAGTLVFSGSLYVLVLSGRRRLGAITPLGGVILIAGWAALFVGTVSTGAMP